MGQLWLQDPLSKKIRYKIMKTVEIKNEERRSVEKALKITQWSPSRFSSAGWAYRHARKHCQVQFPGRAHAYRFHPCRDCEGGSRHFSLSLPFNQFFKKALRKENPSSLLKKSHNGKKERKAFKRKKKET